MCAVYKVIALTQHFPYKQHKRVTSKTTFYLSYNSISTSVVTDMKPSSFRRNIILKIMCFQYVSHSLIVLSICYWLLCGCFTHDASLLWLVIGWFLDAVSQLSWEKYLHMQMMSLWGGVCRWRPFLLWLTSWWCVFTVNRFHHRILSDRSLLRASERRRFVLSSSPFCLGPRPLPETFACLRTGLRSQTLHAMFATQRFLSRLCPSLDSKPSIPVHFPPLVLVHFPPPDRVVVVLHRRIFVYFFIFVAAPHCVPGVQSKPRPSPELAPRTVDSATDPDSDLHPDSDWSDAFTWHSLKLSWLKSQ